MLNRLCVAYGLTMSRLLSEVEEEAVLLLKAEQQPVWQDTLSFQRRNVSPPASQFKAELVEGVLRPARALIMMRRRYRGWNSTSGCSRAS